MNSSKRQASFPLGLMLFAWLLAAYKAATLASEMGAGWHGLLFFVGLDAFFLAVLMLIALLITFARPAFLYVSGLLLLIFLSVTYAIDSFVLLALDEHATWFDITRFSLQPRIVFSFFDPAVYIAITLLIFSTVIFVSATRVVKRFGLAIMLGLALMGVSSQVYAPQLLQRYSTLRVADLLEDFGNSQEETTYTREEVEFYQGLQTNKTLVPDAKPDIILVIVESLSSINSKRVSGQPGWLTGFDTLAEEGLLFTNFFANHQASEGGVIALLGGYPPMHFPTATPFMFDEFAMLPSVTSDYEQQGYFTEFLTNSKLSFIGLNHFLDGIGIDRSRGRDEVGTMKNARRIVQDAPPDDLLYAEALATVEQLSAVEQPYLLVLATTSTHLPYRHPDAGENTAVAVWDWSMRQLDGFYRQLNLAGYFDDGILIITGDHRQMRPLTEAETRRYGSSARARIPLLLIGRDYTPGSVDSRFFQQSDLLRLLGNIQAAEGELSPNPIWVERYNRKYGHIELIDKLSVFDEAEQGYREFRLAMPGNRIEWLGDKPESARRLETFIHKQRSQHQHIRMTRQ